MHLLPGPGHGPGLNTIQVTAWGRGIHMLWMDAVQAGVDHRLESLEADDPPSSDA